MKKLVIGGVIFLVAACSLGFFVFHTFYEVVHSKEIRKSTPKNKLQFVDDQLEDKKTKFDPNFVDRRTYEDWQVNSSNAVITLDCPDKYSGGDTLYSNYIAAADSSSRLLPSINMIDAGAKQFDDGLMAAVDLAYFQGKIGNHGSISQFIHNTFQKLPAESDARPFLAAALELTKDKNLNVSLNDSQDARKKKHIRDFEANPVWSNPISFYTWTDELKSIWRFSKFLQQQLPSNQAVAKDIAAAIESDPKLLEQYRAIIQFYGKLSNPNQVQNIVDASKGKNTLTAVLPAATSRESELYRSVFPFGAPENENLIEMLIRQVRSGKIDLRPKESSGWYSHQVYALESLLNPGSSEGANKLLLKKRYKLRLIEAFKAIIAKKRETHARTMGADAKSERMPPSSLKPRLRVEPNPAFYLRTARAYSFIHSFLMSQNTLGSLDDIHGLSAEGPRPKKLLEELEAIRDRFYGFYIVCCDDIGKRPKFHPEENVNVNSCYELATKYLKDMKNDPDLAKDIRFCVPVYQVGQTTRYKYWGVIGTRQVNLSAYYARAPRIRADEKSPWEEIYTTPSHYTILVDQFVEFSSDRSMNRKPFQAFCDKYPTKSEFLENVKN